MKNRKYLYLLVLLILSISLSSCVIYNTRPIYRDRVVVRENKRVVRRKRRVVNKKARRIARRSLQQTRHLLRNTIRYAKKNRIGKDKMIKARKHFRYARYLFQKRMYNKSIRHCLISKKNCRVVMFLNKRILAHRFLLKMKKKVQIATKLGKAGRRRIRALRKARNKYKIAVKYFRKHKFGQVMRLCLSVDRLSGQVISSNRFAIRKLKRLALRKRELARLEKKEEEMYDYVDKKEAKKTDDEDIDKEPIDEKETFKPIETKPVIDKKVEKEDEEAIKDSKDEKEAASKVSVKGNGEDETIEIRIQINDKDVFSEKIKNIPEEKK